MCVHYFSSPSPLPPSLHFGVTHYILTTLRSWQCEHFPLLKTGIEVCFKVRATSLKLEIRLHAHQVATNTRPCTEVSFTLIWLAHAFGTMLLNTSYLGASFDFYSTSDLQISQIQTLLFSSRLTQRYCGFGEICKNWHTTFKGTG